MGFTNFDTQTDKFNETDLIVDYTKDLGGKVNGSLGFGYYRFPNTTFPDTAEIYGSLSLDTTLKPKIEAHYDWRDGDGFYVQGSLSHNAEFLGIPVSMTMALGYNKGYFIEGEGISHLETTISFPIPLGKNVSAEPFVAHQKSFMQGIEDEIWGGLKLFWTFN